MFTRNARNQMGRFALAVLLAGASAIASATPIVYTFSGLASGTVGMTDFVNAQVTATAQADTSAIVMPATGIYCNDGGIVSITVAGVGSYTTANPNYIFSSQSIQIWGFGTGTCAVAVGDWLDVIDPNAATYALATAIGPSTGTSSERGDVELTGGIFLHFTTPPPTFQARPGGSVTPTTAAPVPTLDTAALALLAVLLAGGATVLLRRRARA